MSDLISRQAAIDALWKINNERDSVYCTSAIHSAVDAIEALPSAERRGRWEFNIDDEEWSWDVPFKCTQCGEWNGRETPYCPNCGARMEGELE